MAQEHTEQFIRVSGKQDTMTYAERQAATVLRLEQELAAGNALPQLEEPVKGFDWKGLQ